MDKLKIFEAWLEQEDLHISKIDKWEEGRYNLDIEEMPKWLFGFWLGKNGFATFFAQPKNNIDKFKPTKSRFCYEGIELVHTEADEANWTQNYSPYCAIREVCYPILFDERLAWYIDNSYGTFPKSRKELDEKYEEHELFVRKD